ncbi:S9 family peptidase [Vibrio sp. SS-MA-C1-2]|uniref:S9 family peptidase n=1 Tax=Vibrio sp. SS-MA-C1-2 TaxID=2908646 RepID=UPI001F157F70|nr:S9 family peptidase [Vibrio sp. SS-MA-C1-2]UJF19818.1 S9 family peptidase [Vibrio sp. SS-MA-C1-2]
MISPTAKRIPHLMEKHQDSRHDPYYWLRNLEQDPDVRAHLEQENLYTQYQLSDCRELQTLLYKELRSRIQEEKTTYPVTWGNFSYFERYVKGQEYPQHWRAAIDSKLNDEHLFLDENKLAGDHPYFDLAGFEVTPDQTLLAYAVDTEGDESYQIRFMDIATGNEFDQVIEGASSSFVWFADSQTLAYVLLDQHHRPYKVKTHTLGQPKELDPTIYCEAQVGEFFIGLDKTQDEKYLLIEAEGAISTEIHWIDANDPQQVPTVIEPRRIGHEYYVDHCDGYFYIQTNDIDPNFRMVKTSVTQSHSAYWQQLIAPSSERMLTSFICFKQFMAVTEMYQGLPQISLLEGYSERHYIEFPEQAYSCYLGDNPEFDTQQLRYGYSSPATPPSLYHYHRQERRSERLKQEPIAGFCAEDYKVERTVVKSLDGVDIPVTLFYHQQTKVDGKAPLLLYGYGAYGVNIKPDFSANVLSLVDRGIVYAICHVRGSSTLGRAWYETGKFKQKENSFDDLNCCAEALVKRNYGAKEQVMIMGGSAGGLLVTAAANRRPDLYCGVVAEVPFVDVLTTMLDPDLPLTQLEYDEWGNPEQMDYYHYIKGYSPYDNIPHNDYPHLLLTAGISDPRVTYWEPAKFALKVRDTVTSDNMVLLHTNMEGGHGGATGRFAYLVEEAMVYSFILKVYGLK